MKKFLLLIALLASCLSVRAEDTVAKRAALIENVRTAEVILQEFQIRPETAIPAAVWRQARAVIILRQVKAGFLFGYKGGYGIVLVKKQNGRWSLPVKIGASEASLGLQIGATTVESIYIITDDNIAKLLFSRRFNVGVDAKAVAGPLTAEAERTDRPILVAPVYIYSRNLGLYAGATVKAAQLVRDDESNFILYNTQYRMPELLYSDWVTPPQEVQGLMNLMQKYAP